MGSKRTNSIIYLMKMGGHWLNYSDYPYGRLLTGLQIFRYVYLVIGWYLNLSLLFTEGVSFLLSPTAVFIPLCLNVVSTSTALLLSHRQIERLVRECERNESLYQEDWEREVFRSDTKVITRISDVILYGMSGFGCIYLLGSVLLDLLRAYMGYEEPYVVPLPLNGYIQEPKTRDLNLYLLIVLSDLWFLFGIPNTVAFECLVSYVVSYTITELKILKRRLRLLYEADNHGVGLLPDWDLRHIIRSHQNIIRLNGLQRKYVTLPYMMQYVLSTFSFCFILFLINQMFGKDSMITVMGGIFTLLMMGMVLIMCFAGESLSSLSTDLFYEIANLPWYRQSPKVRKDITLMLMEANRPLVLDYKEHFCLNLQAYMQIINTGYSYYMLMKSVS